MANYRLTKHIDWSALHNERVRIDVSENYVIGVKKDGSFVIIAQSVHTRSGKKSIAAVPVPLDIDTPTDEVADAR